MEGARRNFEDVAVGIKTNDMKRVYPAKVDEIKGTATGDSQEVIFLVGMQIKLPVPFGGVVGAGGRAIVKHQVAGIRVRDRDVEEANTGRVAEFMKGD